MVVAEGSPRTLSDAQSIAAVRSLVQGFTIETTPRTAAKIKRYRDYLHAGTRVFVTFLPGSDFNDSIATCIRLAGEGLVPVPHIAVRSIPSLVYLREGLQRLVDQAGIDEVLVIAGGVAQPLGKYASSQELLETGLLDEFPIHRIGLAAHPEGSPDISKVLLDEALQYKNEYASQSRAEVYLMTQSCFEAAPIIEWERRIRQTGNYLKIRIGIPGLATVQSLLAHAKACGIGPSMRFLTRQARQVYHLLQVSTPDVLLDQLATSRVHDIDSLIEGIHVYPLGGLPRSAKWFHTIIDKDIVPNQHKDGFLPATTDE